MTASTTWDPCSYAKNARFVSDLGGPLVELLDPKPNEMILDLGCGDGALTAKIAALGCAVLGADASLAQVRAAAQRGLTSIVMDGQRPSLKTRFDAVFSNAAMHWMKEPDHVVAGVARCLKPGGRFVGEFGGHGNVKKIRAALHDGLRRYGIDPWAVDPWYYPSEQEYAKLLEQHGFNIEYIELIPRPTRLPGDIAGWLEVFAQPFTNSVGIEDREKFLGAVRNRLEPRLREADGRWWADYVRLRFKAVRQI